MPLLSFAARSHTGMVREGNEDAFIADGQLALFAVADGLGGHQGGEVASRIAAETIVEFVAISKQDSTITWPYGFHSDISFEGNQLRNAVLLANRRIRVRADAEPGLAGMGSTVTVARLNQRLASFVSVGDSRLYRWRAGTLEQVSEDDTWIAAMRRAGAAADAVRHHQMRHMLTKALGSVAELDAQAHDISLDVDDLLLICSDGLYGPLGDDGIARVLAETSAPDTAAAALIDAANMAGGPDNITVVLVRCAG